ncbi:MAG: NADH-quinone oxidoreductase subunit M [Arenicellales bacterium]|jgi:NADH-quinone oxidoreductase subunit M|nr:NADH-quinone oxidoreductase subunit M [Acidiferrobacteraceae bacterium]MDP6122737.1 NADH-quinone oxidoreductase subunit M [Arenicellales bacterium]MDP6290091.1 NADH-quinone oxidoreductase subunit M [Arenicellales bacterium]MDP6435125.1 NADH-quinone oxidoreductase subunit M [Arenicellales bacterium]MDP6672132.1 NADH-quinone oxidoreductase subunit M [Arenicellales bacterium]|tara:strand:+ start:5505 stop:6989 length:1485 start_codon:yes stop_codon:yes gene_type:complete
MTLLDNNILSLVIWLPILGAIVVLATGGDKNAPLAKKLALGFSLAEFVVSIPLFTRFDRTTSSMQFVEQSEWVPGFGIEYFLGVDGISMPFILLTTILTVVVVIAGWEVIQRRVAHYMAAFLFIEGLMIGVFSALDAVLFYVFWEAMLIPMFLIIGIWGGDNRIYATIKFFLYTLLGSLLMLVAFVYLYFKTGSFNILEFHAIPLSLSVQTLLFFAFFAAFAVKVPMFPVHTWLPDAHTEAPTGGSVILAAIMLKMGAYGFLRFNLPILPDASREMAGFMITLSLIAVVYIALVALVQKDMKRLIAYSSISHMGFVTLGFFIFNANGIEGGIIQMISHGFISGALFLCVGVLYDRMHSRNIDDYGGVVNTMPIFASFMMLFAMANVGLPGTSGFVGEFLVIMGSFQVNGWYAALAATTLIFGAAYTLWMYKRVIFGKVVADGVAALKDIGSREILFLSILAIAVLGLGLWPNPLLEVMHVSVDHLLDQTAISKF